MADETIEFELSCVPCEAKDFNTGRCRVVPKLIDTIGGRINSPVRIETGSGFVFCSLWPRNGGQHKIIQYDTLVTLPHSNKTNRNGERLRKKKISSKNIAAINPVDAQNVIVTLALSNSVDDFQHGQTGVALEMKREKVVRSLLRGCVVMQGCEVKPKESRNNRNSFKGIAKILVTSTEPSTQSLADEPVIINDKTKVTVKLVRRGHFLEDNDNQILAGLDDVARELREILNYPFQYPECFAQLGLECPKGILLQGAPGVGKTLLVKTVTFQCNAQFITLNGTDVFGPYPGESEENLRKTFEIAR